MHERPEQTALPFDHEKEHPNLASPTLGRDADEFANPTGSTSPAAGAGSSVGISSELSSVPGTRFARTGWTFETGQRSSERARLRAVIHVAALYSFTASPSEIEPVNVGGTRNVIAACRAAGVGRLVQTSTEATCGPVQGRVAAEEDSPPHRELGVPYRRTKLGVANTQEVALARLPAWFASAKAQRELGYEHAPVEHSVERAVRAALAIH
jgi:3-beta hydroxysteroid dehydrogenase/isomerase family